MSKELYVSFILDETGSMQSVKQATISGFNEYIDTLKKEKGNENVLFTLTKFNSNKTEIVYSNVSLDFVGKLTDNNYQPAYTTPLYDAIGKTIATMGGIKGKKQKVLMIIQTDGLENASHEYDQKGIFNLISEKKAKGWTFVFLGADQDAWIASEKIGITRGNTMSYSSADTYGTVAYAAANITTSFTRSGGEQSDDLVTTSDTSVKKKEKK